MKIVFCAIRFTERSGASKILGKPLLILRLFKSFFRNVRDINSVERDGKIAIGMKYEGCVITM